MLKLILRYFLVYFIIFLLILGAVSYYLYQLYLELPTPEEVLNYRFDTGSEVFDINGRLIHMYAFEHRKLVELSDVPQYLIDMLLCIEDKNFYNHWGIDIFSVMRAMEVNLRARRVTQGASTISQQLARNMFLSTERIYSRKIKEMMLAVMIESQFTKNEILESYLNKVLFGNGYYGIEQASMNYFLKTSSELTLSESALLVGLLKGSGFYNPLRFPDRATGRRNLVLSVAYENDIISLEQYEEAIVEPLVVNRVTVNSNRESDYFIEFIRPYLERTYGTNQLFTGGLRIYTTIDWEMQEYSHRILNEVLSELDESRRYRHRYSDIPANAVNIRTDYLQGGVFAIDPHTGYVSVMIGGRDFQHSKFNRMMQARRQPGSSFKPFIFANALDNGYTAATIVTDEPLVFMRRGEVFWEPRNYTLDFRGPVRLREALQRSINIVTAKMVYDIGPQTVVDFLNTLDFSTPIHPYLSLSVGSFEVLPYELVAAYSIFPGKGQLVEPVFITRVTDSHGRVLEQATINRRPVLDPLTAYIMTDMMKSVINEGTAVAARNRGFRMPAGGKTGTTDDYRDAWFVGFTRDLVLGVWMGFDDNRTMGRAMTGGVAALPVWIPIMRHYENTMIDKGINTMEDFDMPPGIIRVSVSRQTGLLPSEPDEQTILESFKEFTQPRFSTNFYNLNIFPRTHFIVPEDHIIEYPL
ncbi:MAG: PBP1A family penicillin-binding protein [Candidatus Cloacimonetes bacterium]|nr:PBP1A family penicillin-binding protein [Candidatus Cloacimonadota bacterium]